MQISLKWINELVNIQRITLENLIEKLTLGGFEVEEILELTMNQKKQLALDISATANRSDSLSIQGISVEIAALLNQPTKRSIYSLKMFDWKEKIENLSEPILSENTCSIFVSVILDNINDHTVPKWIQEKLISSGITPFNNLLDFQNYILLETGYPFAFYDCKKLSSKLDGQPFNLSISTAKDNQEFFASNNLKYQLDESTLLVKANEIPISIAGIIEQKDFSYSENTNSLMIEGSVFHAAKIRQQSRKLKLRTDRSARYEKSLKSTYLLESFYRFISLLRISNPNLICRLHTTTQIVESIPKPISLRYQTIQEILGPIQKDNQNTVIYLTPEIVTTYLHRLNFQFFYDKSNFIWEVQIPSLRSDDLMREIDLIEEIGRLHGFNNFVTSLPKIKTIGMEDSSYQTRKKITSCLLNLGLTELIHYSLVNQTTFLENEIQLVNPLFAECSHLRISLLPNLIKTVQENFKQGNLFMEGFEYGHVFSGDRFPTCQEKEHVAGIFGGIETKLTWSDSSKRLTWFEAKGKIEQFLQQLNLLTYWKRNSSLNVSDILHSYRSAELYFLNGQRLGVFGQINPILANRFTISPEIYLFEFDLKLIQHQIQINKLAISKEYSLYPKIIKDLSFIVPQNIQFQDIQEILYKNGTQFLSEINLLDEYRGHSIPKEHMSLCLQLIFQSSTKTLQNKEIENIIQNLQFVLTTKFSAIIRE